MTTATLSEPDHIRRIVSQIGTWQRLTLVLVNRQGFERSTPIRPGGEIGRLIDDEVLRHGTLRVDGANQYVLLPGPRFGAVMEAMVSA
jgi:hypothetical protein